jgi:hypothetical protein
MLNFDPKLKIWSREKIFQGHVKKFSKKKCASKVGWKVSKKTLKRKLVYVNPIFWSFSGEIDTNVIFEHNFEKKYFEKNRKNAKFLLLFGLFYAFKT